MIALNCVHFYATALFYLRPTRRNTSPIFTGWAIRDELKAVFVHDPSIANPARKSLAQGNKKRDKIFLEKGPDEGMTKEKKIYSRYIFNRGLQTLWKGDAAVAGSQFRSVVLTSDDFNSTQATFQVLALEGTGKGIKDGKLASSDEDPKILFDKDLKGLDAAAKQFNELVASSEKEGFTRITFMDIAEFEAKARASKK